MTKRFSTPIAAVVCAFLLVSVLVFRPTSTNARPQQYPVMDAVANKVIAKYQNSTCEQLWITKSAKAPPSAEEQKVIAFLKSDPQMRAAFIAKVAPPIASKMFDCGMVP